MLSGLLYWELFEAMRTGAAKAPDAVLKTIATERAMLALLNMVVSPRLSIEGVFRRLAAEDNCHGRAR